LLFISFSGDARLYKWIDAHGEVRYGDQLPPGVINKKHFLLDPEGRIILTKEAGKSSRQLKKDRALAKQRDIEIKKEKSQLAHQKRQDRILLLTFNSEEDIFYARDQRLLVLDTKISLLNKNKQSSQKKLLALEEQADKTYRNNKRKVPGGLQQKMEQMQRKITATNKNISSTQDKRAMVVTDFEKDLARFKDLKQRQRIKNTQ
jgi:hypothetical protein